MVRLVLSVATLAMALAMACTTAPSGPANPPAANKAPAASTNPASSTIPVGFFLELQAPLDEAVVTVSTVPVQGRTAPDAVATVNGEVVEVDAQGNFLVQVTLEEGPNSIEVLASDFAGNQQGHTLTVVYIP